MLSVAGVSRWYGAKCVLRDISGEFAQGTITLVRGRNGSGKTTLLRILAGLLEPSSGTVTCEDPSCRLAYVSHTPCFYPGLSAIENLRFWNTCLGSPRTDGELFSLLDAMELSDCAEEPAATFSRGMAQKLNLARALIVKPGIFLLDEPETGLDAEARGVLLTILSRLRGEGVCILLISHTLGAEIGHDAVLTLRDGTLVREDPCLP